MTFLPDVPIKCLKEAMDPRESLHVADLGKANFSATMSNVDEPKGGMLRTPDSLKPGIVSVSALFSNRRRW
jgi:hypothetical protein